LGAKLAVPDFGADRPDGVTGFNDLMLLCGPEAVNSQIAAYIRVCGSPEAPLFAASATLRTLRVSILWVIPSVDITELFIGDPSRCIVHSIEKVRASCCVLR
jgi:hypothetical protein